MNEFEKTIKSYLDNRAAEDPQFAVKYSSPKKSIERCCDYIVQKVRESGRQGFADEEIYGFAMHYYDEENITVTPGDRGTVVVNHRIDLSEKEKAQAREQAIKEYQEKVINDMKRPKSAPQKSDEVLSNQMSLF